MSVLIETSLGDIVIDLLVEHAPRACENFLKLCKIKYYNGALFHLVQKGRLVQTGDPTGTGSGGCSVFGLLDGKRTRFFDDELSKRFTHAAVGTVSMATCGPNTNASQFLITTGPALHHLDETHTIFGRVAEGLDVLGAIDGAYVDADGRPYQNIRIRHTIVLDDPYPDPAGLQVPDRSPEPTAEQLRQDRERLADDEALDDHEGRTAEELEEALAAQAAKSRAEVLEMLGDLPDADVAPPENVLFVCKLNPITQDDDLEIIFSRFGDIKKCEIIRDPRTGDSLNYAFIEFGAKEECEKAYLKMDGALIDDRRVRVDFSQSVAKTWNQYRRKEPMARLAGADDGGGLGGGRGGGGRGGPRLGGLGGGGRGGAPQPRFGAAAAQPQQQRGQQLVFDLPPPPPPPPQMAQQPPPHDGGARARPSRWGERPAEPSAGREQPRASDVPHGHAPYAPPPPPPARADARRSRSPSSSRSSSRERDEGKRAKHHKKASHKSDKRHKDGKAERSRDKHRHDSKRHRSDSDKHRRSDKHDRADKPYDRS